MRIYSTSTPDDFWARVAKQEGCWEWQGAKINNGYGHLHYQRQHWTAHRLAYTLAVSPIPNGLWVLHRCDNRRCCNPAHLYLGTIADNTRDMIERGRAVFPPRMQGDQHWSRQHKDLMARGEGIRNSKLKSADVLRIREQYAAGNATLKQLAQDHGVTYQAIWNVVRRRAWQHLP